MMMLRTLLFVVTPLAVLPAAAHASAWLPDGDDVTAPAPTSDQFAATREVVAKMQQAVAAGNADAYLELVDRDEHEWWHEQKAWAKDIATKTPESITITTGDDWTLTTFHDTPAVEVSLTWAWTPKADERVAQPKEGDPVPASRERQLTFRARFLQREGGLRYAGEAWQLVEREGVIVAFDPGLEKAANAAAAAFAKIRGGVEVELGLANGPIVTRTQRIKLYGSMRHLQHSIYPSYVFPLSGWNEPNEAIKAVSKPDATERNFIALLAHEYGHVASFELGPKANYMPWWALEGIAEAMVDAHDPMLAKRSRKQVNTWQREGVLAAFADLADFEKVPLKLHGYVYRQGHDMIRFVTDTFGREKRNAWLAAMSNGDTIEAASEKELGQSWEIVQETWREAIKILPEEPATD
ncbi:MAG TPA: hypothetical protein VK157_11670, partial [Phycisphaerales bacterium]|nr:hypothetical protein [Phycisphaerales bacterium]